MQTWKYISILTLILTLVIKGYGQKESPPVGTEPKDFSLPAIQDFTLDNGLQVSMVQFGNLPKALVRVILQTGNLNETADQTWIADLTGALLKEGTSSRSAADIASEAAMMGGTVNITTRMDQSWVEGEVLSEFAPNLVNLLADILRHPAFPEKSFERLRNDFIRNLNISRSQPQNLAEEKFLQILYPDHPYGRVYPAEDRLKNYTLEQVKSFYQENFGAVRAHVYVTGKFEAGKVKKAIESAFTDWPKGNQPLVNIPQPQSTRAIYLVDRPNAPQSTIYLGLPVVDPSHPDYIKLGVTNTLLGGYFSSRITANIREDKGYTYSPYSSITSHYRDAFWRQQADVTTAVTGASLKEIFYEIDRLQKDASAPEELQGVLNFIAGTFILRNSSRGGIINQLAFTKLHGLPDDYLMNYIKNLYTVTPQDVQLMAQKYLRADEMIIVIVGDKKLVPAQVKPYGTIAKH